MSIISDGWTNWEVAFFKKFFFANDEITVDQPNRMRYPRQGAVNNVTTLAGTNIHQPMWLGGDAPINLQALSPIELDFQSTHLGEFRKISRLSGVCAFEPQSFFANIWIEDFWFIPAAPAAQTEWQISRFFPYDLVNINDPTGDYKPVVSIDNVDQTIINSGTPTAGQVKILAGVESHKITLPAASTLVGSKYLRLFYTPKMYICSIDTNEEIPDSDDYTMGLTMQEHLPNRRYNFSIS